MHELTIFKQNLPSIDIKLEDKTQSLSYWFELYFSTQVLGSPKETIGAKKKDIVKFLNYFQNNIKTNNIDYWTTSVTKAFQGFLLNVPYSATTINRIFATLRHAANWIQNQRPFLAGHPFTNIRDVAIDDPAWKGLTSIEITRLKVGCDHRLMICKRANQNAYLETAVFYILLHTGLREFELIGLNIDQYHSRGFHNVIRKGRKVTRKVHLPQEAREVLDKYLEKRSDIQPNEPLLVTKNGNRLNPRDVQRICNRIASQASAQLSIEEKIRLTPHMLRHTFLKNVADSEGVHVAQALSGNISMREIFRYTKPSHDEIESISEKLAKKF
ncbi:MAG: tyrosine-type recombinase/integrase [Sphingobacteriia bacterium]|nr:tyrosine-type recombinase/integrase [Sphingobacteriia bacterium]